MMRLDQLPVSFPFRVHDTERQDTVAVFRAVSGRLQNSGKKVIIAPFAKNNMDQVARIIAQLRTRARPDIEYITNQFIDVHRSSGRSHVVGALLTNTETRGDHFDLTDAARQGLANRIGNCDRVNAAANRMITLFDIKDPVLFYWTTAGDHNVSLVGDPRMAKYGEHNTVVLDPYVVFPMPHTLAEASYDIRIPKENEAGHADLEVWDPQDPSNRRFESHPLPAPISDANQHAWLQARGWPADYGADVVKAWHDTEQSETGQPPDRWDSLFSCKNPAVRYSTGDGPGEASNRFPAAFVTPRVQALLELDKLFPKAVAPSPSVSSRAQRPLPARATAAGKRPETMSGDATKAREVTPLMADIHANPLSGLSLQHVTPMDTVVTDRQTGEVVMEIHGAQIPVDRVNHGFPIKDPQKPWAIHPEYVSDTDPFRCHGHVKIGHVEIPPQTKKTMRAYVPAAAAAPDYFAARAAEIRAEYEAPLNKEKPPSALCWTPKRLIAQECYNDAQARALVGAFGVVAADSRKQNVGGMGPAFAGAELRTAAQRRQYIAQTSKAAFDDFAMRTGNPGDPGASVRFAPYGGGNLAQFMNGKATPEDEAHFIAVDVIVYTINRFGESRRVVAPHFFQIAEVPPGKQAILDYGDGGYFYGGKRPGMSLQGPDEQHPVKMEPTDDDVTMTEVPGRKTAARPSRSSGKRPAEPATPLLEASGGQATRLRQSPVDVFDGAVSSASSSTGVTRGSTTRRQQALPLEAPEDDDLSSLSSAPDTEMDDSEFEGGETAAAGARQTGKQASARRGRTDQEIIDDLPEGLWEEAQELAKAQKVPGLSLGPSNNYHALRKVAGKTKHFASFSILPDRDAVKARTMAIAIMLLKTRDMGLTFNNVEQKDQAIIDNLPEGLWEEALELAKAQKVAGISFKPSVNIYSASRKVAGKTKHFASFSILPERDAAKARAMTIALMLVEMKKMGLTLNDVEQKDQTIIDKLPKGMWEAAKNRAGQAEPFSGVWFKKPGLADPAGRYMVSYQGQGLGSFAPMERRDMLKARALAIATRWMAEAATPQG